MKRWLVTWCWLALSACKTPHIASLAATEANIIELVQKRSTPDIARARFAINIESTVLKIAGSTNGGIVLNRPSQARIEIFSPLGGSLATAVSNGELLSLVLSSDKLYLSSDHAETMLRTKTDGAVGIDDFVGILEGDLPIENGIVEKISAVPGGPIEVRLIGPKQSRFIALLDRQQATPVSFVAMDTTGKTLVEATYEPFQKKGEWWLPTTVHVRIPSLELDAEIRYKSWEILPELSDAFTPVVPEGYREEDLESWIAAVAASLPLAPEERQ